tara:strand:- start:706 stop:975 length:270 start_codon:yes stop_codon:yes gene_type:complete
MPSKNGFGNSRTPLTKKAQYGVDQKNPIKITGFSGTSEKAQNRSDILSGKKKSNIGNQIKNYGNNKNIFGGIKNAIVDSYKKFKLSIGK